jgi:hypothetical protein
MLTCARCEKSLPEEAFWRQNREPTGRASACKLCLREWRKGRHTTGKPRERSQEKEQARSRLRDAVRRGRLLKPTHCEQCQRETPRHLLDGHHHDYTKPLEVKWLCRRCHGLEALTWPQAA